MRLGLVLVTIVALSGCASLSRETVIEESVWQAENVVDLMQTTQISRQPARYDEVGTMSPFTGPHPSEGQVVFFSALFGGLHFAATDLIAEHLDSVSPWFVRSWEAGSLCFKTRVILHNREIGLNYTTHF
jgi:hypothetical protein